MLNKLLFLIVLISLSACSSTNEGIQYINKTPRGIKAVNITKEMDSRAYQNAEVHCAKYSKVPRVKARMKQQTQLEEVEMMSITFDCIRP